MEVPKYFGTYIASEEGQALLIKYLEDNKEEFLQQYRAADVKKIDEEILAKSKDLETIRQNIQEESALVKEDKIFENLPPEDRERIKLLISEEETRNQVLQYYDASKDISDLNYQLAKLEGQRERFEADVTKQQTNLNDLKEALKKVKDDFLKGSDFAKKVIDAKIYSDLINNIDPSYNDEDSIITLGKSDIKLTTIGSQPRHFIEEIQTRLTKQNRTVNYNDLVNYLVLINQNFLVVVAGLPGVGKTSLVEKLAKALGAEENNRYLKISVSRGWTSSKDLLGYFNPLTKKYQESKTGLYKLLKLAEADNLKALELPTLVLLDEANLSSMEHYWSDFLSLADADYKKEIATSDNEKIKFGMGVRFLATINYDHTTEILSDRLLSRAPVIRLNISDYKSDDAQEVTAEIFDTFSMAQINASLNNGVRDGFKGDIKNKFDNIVKVLQDEDNSSGQPIIIGVRKYRAVEKYCNVAGTLMESNNKFTALDYAIFQHILPLLNGRGDGFLKRLSDLKEQLQTLPMSLRHLNRMIQFGNDNFKNYKFFC